MSTVEASSSFADNTLKTWSSDPVAEARRLTQLPFELRRREFLQNLDTYTNEVIENQPVSLLYHYWFGHEGHLFTGPERLPIQRTIHQIDERERHGLPRAGFERVERLLLDNSGDVVLWYSPKGPAAFTEDPENPYSEIDYDYGQLYIQQFDGNKVDAVAIKVTNETAVEALFQKAGLETTKKDDDSYARIRNYLLSPQAVPMTLDSFVNYDWDLPVVFSDKHRGNYYWSDIATDIRTAFAGKKRREQFDKETTVAMLNKQIITEQDVMRAYLLNIKRAMNSYGISKLELSGSCGGGEVNEGDIDALLGIRGDLVSLTASFEGLFRISVNELVGLYSSGLRLATQAEKKTTYQPGTCIGCHMNKDRVGDCGICTDCEKN